MHVAGVLVIGSLVMVIFFMTMAIVFSAIPSIIYPEPVVNVIPSTNGSFYFYVRCDIAAKGSRSVLASCNTTEEFAYIPLCPLLYNYYDKVYALGSVKSCPTGYLRAVTSTVNLNVNLVALVSSMMAVGAILMFVTCIVTCACSMKGSFWI